MKCIKIIFVIILNYFILSNFAFAEQKIKFVDIDQIIQETLIGKQMLKELNELDKINIKKLNDFENELKIKDSEIKSKKNIISEKELNNEINELNLKLTDYRKLKDNMVKKLSEKKNNELQKFFKTINPIIQNYMENNSIEIVLNSKNVLIGNKNSDLTKILIEEINSKIID